MGSPSRVPVESDGGSTGEVHDENKSQSPPLQGTWPWSYGTQARPDITGLKSDSELIEAKASQTQSQTPEQASRVEVIN